MYPLAKSFFDLALLRLAPQQLPASGFLLSLVVVLFLLIETFGYHITVANWRVSFIVTIVDIGLMALFAKAVLDLSSHSGRLFKPLNILRVEEFRCGSSHPPIRQVGPTSID